MNENKSVDPNRSLSGVIWISGYSASGKTTVGRKVVSLLMKSGQRAIFLDGDELRSIFSNRWGYEREERVDLAHVYFRLSSHLASQGYTVVISAVAMFNEIRDWVSVNIPRSMQVFLKVPYEERVNRDSKTKGIYKSIGNQSEFYDEPRDASVFFDNSNAADPNVVANKIVDEYIHRIQKHYDLGRKGHWNNFYSLGNAPDLPSPFALSVSPELSPHSSILEIGCGNGRDSNYFSMEGHLVTGLDVSESAIEYCGATHKREGLNFLLGTLPILSESLNSNYDVIYSRFVIHAMPLEEEVGTLEIAFEKLRKAGKLYIECRSINDPMARKGEVISPTERIFGHYRRFIILEDLVSRLEGIGFHVLNAQEGSGLAKYGDDDPVVIRVVAGKPDA